MPRYKVLYKSKEEIYARHKHDEPIEYTGTLTIKDGGKTPVTLDLIFVPPPPCWTEVPEKRLIKAGTITEVYTKLVRFLKGYGYALW